MSAGEWGVSLLVHVAVISMALYATQSVGHARTTAALDRAVVVIPLPEPQDASPPPRVLELLPKDPQTITFPTVISSWVPPVNLQEHVYTRNFAIVSSETETVIGLTPMADQEYDPNLVDDPPILLSSPPLVPALIPRTGPTGRVVVLAVIDTAGRVDPASVRVIQSADSAFEHNARQWMLASLWRPARVGGHPVRLWVHRAIDYTVIRFR
jgi:outer membrane biosynthesis protein TonB